MNAINVLTLDRIRTVQQQLLDHLVKLDETKIFPPYHWVNTIRVKTGEVDKQLDETHFQLKSKKR